MVEKMPKSLEMVIKLQKGESPVCPYCEAGNWVKIKNDSGQVCGYKCEGCGRQIIPRFNYTK